jgi:hypothetical protein
MQKSMIVSFLIGGLLIAGCEPPVPTKASKPAAIKKPEDSPVIKDKLPHKLDLSILEKLWKVKIKSIRHREEVGGKDAPRNAGNYEILLEFTETLDERATEQMTEAIESSRLPFEFYYLDADNVVLRRVSAVRVMGEITGTKGDAFRLTFPSPTESEIVRLEAREFKADRRSHMGKDIKDK